VPHGQFIERIVALQRQRQLQAAAAPVDVQLHDRSPICTLALSRYMGLPDSQMLTNEIDRITHDRLFERVVFFVRKLGFCEPTAARKISFADAVKFERVHRRSIGSSAMTSSTSRRPDIPIESA
jgi:predicted ATPase